jgi:hypothetical protein
MFPKQNCQFVMSWTRCVIDFCSCFCFILLTIFLFKSDHFHYSRTILNADEINRNLVLHAIIFLHVCCGRNYYCNKLLQNRLWHTSRILHLVSNQWNILRYYMHNKHKSTLHTEMLANAHFNYWSWIFQLSIKFSLSFYNNTRNVLRLPSVIWLMYLSYVFICLLITHNIPNYFTY